MWNLLKTPSDVTTHLFDSSEEKLTGRSVSKIACARTLLFPAGTIHCLLQWFKVKKSPSESESINHFKNNGSQHLAFTDTLRVIAKKITAQYLALLHKPAGSPVLLQTPESKQTTR